jgi:hypothetical protein
MHLIMTNQNVGIYFCSVYFSFLILFFVKALLLWLQYYEGVIPFSSTILNFLILRNEHKAKELSEHHWNFTGAKARSLSI